ncbi:MAG: hypothetical protein IKP45_08090 [Bacteroidales bacterium]|nr:hypothetical protein [Bacteroidales bacterium]
MKRTILIAVLFLIISAVTFAQSSKATTGKLNGHEWVDLGLPSGTKWATCNIGAASPDDDGEKFRWGKTITENFRLSGFQDHYDFSKYTRSDKLTVLEAYDDVANCIYGAGWRMPTKEDFEELASVCTHHGGKFVGPNGNFIILPYTNLYSGGVYYDGAIYWSSSLGEDTYNAYYFDVNGVPKISESNRSNAYLVRPVCNSNFNKLSNPMVVKPGTCGKTNGHEWVDLGLPSGTKWATCNVGANRPEDFGDYFAWGETRTKTSYTDKNNTYSSKPAMLPASADAAAVNWGNEWRMPTKEEFEELASKCKWIRSPGGGYKVVGPNGNSIYLRAAGYNSNGLKYLGYSCYYWSSSCKMAFKGENIEPSHSSLGMPIRPVVAALIVSTVSVENNNLTSVILKGNVTSNGGLGVTACGFYYGTSKDDLTQKVTLTGTEGAFSYTLTGLTTGKTYYYKAYATNMVGTNYGKIMSFSPDHEWVDLGLPSGTKWATCNIGANNPEDYGDYFAWGETTPKRKYNIRSYKYYHDNFFDTKLTKYCVNSSDGDKGFIDNLTELQSTDDAATANWGKNWRMPTKGEMNELWTKCTKKNITQNGVHGLLFVGPNGNSIFLPSAGRYTEDGYGVGGFYWSCSLDPNAPFSAKDLKLDVNGHCDRTDYRYRGQSVRPVYLR